MISTTVFNLKTGETLVFFIPPLEALIAAHEQEKGNYNTWSYPTPESVQFIYGKLTIALGNLCYYNKT